MNMAAQDGFLTINKPKSWTSFDVIAKLRGITGVRSIGHAGTLDPFATGVLVVALDKARFLVDKVQEMEKVYRGRIRLGQTSDTDDVEGKKGELYKGPQPDLKIIRLALTKFSGEIEQTPPNYSALKLQGKKMYELARKGKPVPKKTRKVTIYDIKDLAYSWPHLDIETRVSKGTYIRAIARDLGQDLGTGAYLEELVRHKVGIFELNDAQEISDITRDNYPENLTRIEEVLNDELKMVLPAVELERLAHGERVKAPPSITKRGVLPYLAIVNKAGKLLMLAEYDSKTQLIKSKKIFDESLRR